MIVFFINRSICNNFVIATLRFEMCLNNFFSTKSYFGIFFAKWDIFSIFAVPILGASSAQNNIDRLFLDTELTCTKGTTLCMGIFCL